MRSNLTTWLFFFTGVFIANPGYTQNVTPLLGQVQRGQLENSSSRESLPKLIGEQKTLPLSNYEELISRLLSLRQLSEAEKKDSKWEFSVRVETAFDAPFAFRLRETWTKNILLEFVTPKENVWDRLNSTAENKLVSAQLLQSFHSYRCHADSRSNPEVKKLGSYLQRIRIGIIPPNEYIVDGTALHIRVEATAGTQEFDLNVSRSSDLGKWLAKLRSFAWPRLHLED